METEISAPIKENQKKMNSELSTRTCKCCGRELPITEFKSYNGGKYATICNTCKFKKGKGSDKFKEYTTRELLDELKLRGWSGQLQCRRIETITI